MLWGACDPLITPRAIGPLRDVARAAGGALLAALDGSREDVLAAALDELAARAVLVVEDLHWADDGTLDLVALLGRRLVRSPGALVLTCRSEALADRPEVRRVIATLPRECVRRIEPRPLSAGAVALLAERAGRPMPDLHAASGGNPFYVTEVLAAADRDGVPASVRDAVALRVAGTSPAAREVVELAAVVPGAAEVRLFGARAAAIDECIARGAAHAARRHGRASATTSPAAPSRTRSRRSAAASSTGSCSPCSRASRAPTRRASRTTPGARATSPRSAASPRPPPARRARRAATARRSSTGRRRSPPRRAPTRRAGAPRSRASRSRRYLCGRPERALEARRALLAIHEASGDALRAGDDLRWLSRVLWWSGRGEEATAVGDRAIAALEAFPDEPRARDGAQRPRPARDARRAPRRRGRARHARRGARAAARRHGDRRPRADERRLGAAQGAGRTSAAARCSTRRSPSPPAPATTTTPPAPSSTSRCRR